MKVTSALANKMIRQLVLDKYNQTHEFEIEM